MKNHEYQTIENKPTSYDDYLVKTKEGTYEFAHFNSDGWTIRGDNKGATPVLWTPIPTTDKLKLGMYGEMPIVKIGKFSISMQTNNENESKIWVMDGEDEGSGFDGKDLESDFQKLFDKHF